MHPLQAGNMPAHDTVDSIFQTCQTQPEYSPDHAAGAYCLHSWYRRHELVFWCRRTVEHPVANAMRIGY